MCWIAVAVSSGCDDLGQVSARSNNKSPVKAKKIPNTRRRSNSCTLYDIALQQQRLTTASNEPVLADIGLYSSAQSGSNDSLPEAATFWTSCARYDSASRDKQEVEVIDVDDCSQSDDEVLPLFQRLTLNASKKISSLPSASRREEASSAESLKRIPILPSAGNRTKKELRGYSVVDHALKQRRENLKKRVATILSDEVFAGEELTAERDDCSVSNSQKEDISLNQQIRNERCASTFTSSSANNSDDSGMVSEQRHQRNEIDKMKSDTPSSVEFSVTPWSARHVGNFNLETSLVDDLTGDVILSSANCSVTGGVTDENQARLRRDRTDRSRDSSLEDFLGEFEPSLHCGNSSSSGLWQPSELFPLPLAERLKRRVGAFVMDESI